MADYPVREFRFDELEAKTFDCQEPTIYAILKDGVRFEFLIKREQSSSKAVVFGTGTMSRPQSEWPFFSRHTWMNSLPYNCIYYFDPTLYIGSLELAWCYGSNERWYLRDISEILCEMLQCIQVSPRDVLMTGSSGGGFTSIMLSVMLHTRCMAINPQTDIRRYWGVPVQKLRRAIMKPGEDWVGDHVSVSEFMFSEGYCPHLHIIQNILVPHDIDNQLTPFIKELCNLGLNCGPDRLRISFYSDKNGHGAMPPKETCLNYIRQEISTGYSDWNDQNSCLEITSAFEDLTKEFLNCEAEYELHNVDLTVRIKPGRELYTKLEFAFYLYLGKQVVKKNSYTENCETTFYNLQPGCYHVKYFIRVGNNQKQSFSMEEIIIS